MEKVPARILAWLIVSMATCCWRVVSASGNHPEQIHLALGEKVSEMTVMWSTSDKTEKSIVEYGTSEQDLHLSQTGVWHLLANGFAVQYIHNVKLENLQPATKYWYRCGNGKTWGPVYGFKTFPGGSDWRPKVIVFGDLGYRGGVSARSLAKEAKQGTVDVMIHNGDIAYDLHTDNGRVGDNFMNMIQPFAAKIPYMVGVGNHEAFNWNFTNYKARFDMPGTPDNLWYSFKVGPIHFVVMSTEVYFFLIYGGMEAVNTHYNWLEDTLRLANHPKNREKWPWVIVLGHRPMYCSNTALRYCRLESNPVRVGILGTRGIEKLLYDYGVDMAFWGHNHCYERLFPTYDGEVYNGTFKDPYKNPRAPVHVTSGVAGNQEGISNFRGFRRPWSAFGSTENGYTKVIPMNKTHLYFEQISSEKDGRLIDSVFIIKDKHGAYSKLYPEDKKKMKTRQRFGRLKELFGL